MLVWNAYIENINRREIEVYNIFNHGGFYEDLYRATQKYKRASKVATKLTEKEKCLEEFKEDLRRSLLYYFWSKCEWEIVMTSWPTYIEPSELQRLNAAFLAETAKYGHEPRVLDINLRVEKKVDVYDQVMSNFGPFMEYILTHIKEIKKPKKY